MKNFKQFLNENNPYEKESLDQTVFISIRFEDIDDKEAFEHTFDLTPTKSNYVESDAKLKDIPYILYDLKNVYGIDDMKIKIK